MHEVTSPRIYERFCERFCVGLTGGIASGKSTAAEHFVALGVGVVDTDVIAHHLTQTGGQAMPAIEAQFGAAALNADGSLNRAAMRALVFGDASQRTKLEAILHPMIHLQTQTQGELVAGPYVVFVLPLLAESSRWRARVDRIAVVDCEPTVQLARLLQRPGLSLEQAQQIMAAQASREQRLALADDIAPNHGDKKALLTQIEKLHDKYLTFSHTRPSTIR
jgi:dephospho-CoA kinase